MPLNPSDDYVGCDHFSHLIKIDMYPWPVMLFGQFPGERRSARQLATGNDQGAV
jgi:hypothetical protein